MDITQNTDYVGEGLGRLLEQFKGKPRIAALLTSWLDECQEIEDAMWDVFIDRLLQLNLATGDLLAKIGKIVGQGSEGLTDDQFRLLILARILVNRSNGRVNELLAIARKLVPDTTTKLICHLYYKQIWIWATDAVPLPPNLVAFSFLGLAKAAGDRLDFLATTKPFATTFLFGWSGDPSIPGAGHLLGWSGDSSTGGTLIYDYVTTGGTA